MRIAGTVCEFDPFHNGHRHLFDKIREQGASGIVCVMSGDFVQRGGPAVCDKFLRAEAAVRCGADLVLELPAVYAVNSADRFARGAVRILKGLGCVDTIAFGSETGDDRALLKIAELTAFEKAEFSDAIKTFLADGVSYPAAYKKALVNAFPELDPAALEGPNDILAVCYLREIIKQNADLEPFAVKRVGAGHGSADTDGAFASASFIRESMAAGNDVWQRYVPDQVRVLLSGPDYSPEELALRKERSFALARHALISSGRSYLELIPEISEGLENRLLSSCRDASDLDSLVSGAVSGRYTASRIRRVLTQLVLGMTGDFLQVADSECSAYAKVLAFNSTGAKILGSVNDAGTIPVISNINKNAAFRGPEAALLDLDIRAADIYSIICGRSISDHSDRVQIPKMLQL